MIFSEHALALLSRILQIPERRMKQNKVIETLGILGKPVTDKVTGIQGVATSVSFDLYGCIQVVLDPPASDKDSKAAWYDLTRMKVGDGDRVMEVPDFDKGYIAEGKKGPAEKPVK